MGTIADLPTLPETVESGAQLPVAVVTLEDEKRALIPLANLELIH
jgi:hypothetical protein